MLVHFGIDNLKAEWSEAVTCIGTFDGVHLGHRHVLDQLVTQAKSLELPSVIVTFDRHPHSVLRPDDCPEALGTLEQNVIALRTTGASVCIIMPFNHEIASWSAERFFLEVLKGAAKTGRVVVGHDFAFGKGREGTHEFLQARLPTQIVSPFEINGARISSSQIRLWVQNGQIERAQEWLGRPYALAGVVVRGQKLGRELGFPTLNLARSVATVLPKDGVYACRCSTPLGEFDAAVSIGMRPAVCGQSRTIEAHLLDYAGPDLYGCRVELHFMGRIRDEWDFPSLAALKSQIDQDVQDCKQLLATT